MTPALSPSTLRAMRSTRLVISAAARRENVPEQDTTGVGTLDDQVGDPMGEGGCWSFRSPLPQ